jgi:hypothetical protein
MGSKVAAPRVMNQTVIRQHGNIEAAGAFEKRSGGAVKGRIPC